VKLIVINQKIIYSRNGIGCVAGNGSGRGRGSGSGFIGGAGSSYIGLRGNGNVNTEYLDSGFGYGIMSTKGGCGKQNGSGFYDTGK
jgi:hypothetical protein